MTSPLIQSLSVQTYRFLRDAIASGQWENTLPGERSLCDQFQISRPTLRQALARLEKEGVIENKHGHKRRILKAPPQARNRKRPRRIAFLSPEQIRDMLGYTSRKIAAIEHIVSQKGFEFIFQVRPSCYSQSPERALDILVNETKADCWILQQSSARMQAWFEANKVPVVITGTRHEGVNLPYADLDNAAICRHAVGLLAAKKRHTICYLTTRDFMAGDLLSEAGFLAGINAHDEVNGFIARHNGEPENICSKLDSLLARKQPPDAIIVDKCSHAYSVASHLSRKGVAIPKDMALICRTASRDFRFMRPPITHYARNSFQLAKKTAELAMKTALNKSATTEGKLIIPELVPGGTV